jgi:hypothetical protein
VRVAKPIICDPAALTAWTRRQRSCRNDDPEGADQGFGCFGKIAADAR